MRLFFTSTEFTWKGITRERVPFLCNAEMELVPAPNAYLLYVASIRGRTRSPRTWETYGNHLYEFFSFLEINGMAWNDMDQSRLAAWRDSMLERGCVRSTVNQRLRCVCGFYEWAVRSNHISQRPFAKEDIWINKGPGFLAHVDAGGNQFNANELTVQTHQPLPKFLILENAIRFLESARPHALKLMGYLALLVGMRREEIVALDYRVIPNPAGHDSGKLLPMILDSKITPTKGNKTRTVMLPYDLAVALWDYFSTLWPKLNRMHKLKFGRESTRVFLSKYGGELSIRYLNNAFRKVGKRSGIECHPHMLRHTYGTYEFLRMNKHYGQTKALLWVRDRMGHSSIRTTEIYIHAADLVRHTAVDDYQLDVLESLSNGATQAKSK
jgi:site-specific recombinase XerD